MTNVTILKYNVMTQSSAKVASDHIHHLGIIAHERVTIIKKRSHLPE